MSALPDQPQRDRILGADPADLHRSFAVEAGAGSGKTTALVGRLIALVEAGEPLREVVAITFTRKAAAELRAQAYRRFAARAAHLAAEAGRTPEDERRLARLRAALGDLDAACIDTIHGFCARLLRADAHALGLPPDFAVVEEREADEMRRDFWRRYVAERHQEAPEDTERLAEVGLRPDALEPLFASLLLHADRLPKPYGAPLPDLGPAVEAARERLNAWQALRPDPPLRTRDALQKALDRAHLLLEVRGTEAPPDQARFLEALLAPYNERTGKASITQNAWGTTSAEKQRAKAIAETEMPELAGQVLPSLRAWEAHVYDRALAFARGAVEAFAEERRREGTLTFDDILQAAADLLRRSPAARRRAAQRYRRLFVDEFQDTDPVQAEVLFLLAAENLDETDWRRCRPRPGSLFLVGDPKQSIYRFRRADIETYEEARRRLGEEAQLQLTACFRTLPALCEALNARLRGPFEEGRAKEGGHRRQAAYADLHSARPRGPAQRPAAPALARIDVERVSRHSAAEIAEADAEAIAAFVRAAVDGRAEAALYQQPEDRPRPEAFGGDLGTVFGPEARYGDFLVLCRNASRFPVYTAALERYGIPYTLAGDKGLGQADELRALVALLDAVRDPLDEIGRLAHFTGLLGGLDAPALLAHYARTDDGPSPLESSPEDDEARALIIRAAEAEIDEARADLEALPLAAALERILTRSGLLAWAARREGGADRAGGLLKLLALARRYEAEGLHWSEALEHLRALLEGEATDGRITLEEGTPEALRLMTAHQAKGLQAPVVFLADPYARPSPPPAEHVGRGEDGRPYATVPFTRASHPASLYRTLVAAPARWHEHDAAEAALYEEAEARRLAYVAATRARGLLVVSRYLEKSGEGPWGDLHAGLDEVPALEALHAPAAPPEPVPLPLGNGAERRSEALERAARPSLRARTVTEGGRDPFEAGLLGAEAEGHGAAFGTAVHALFEWAVRHRHEAPPPAAERALAERLWAEHHVRARPVEHALAALAALRASELWRRLLEAEEVHAEVPVAAPLGGTRGATLWRGVIDLAFLDGDGWHLVDYKTEGGDLAAYLPQLRTYARLWAAAAGAPPASLQLWSTARGAPLAVPLEG